MATHLLDLIYFLLTRLFFLVGFNLNQLSVGSNFLQNASNRK